MGLITQTDEQYYLGPDGVWNSFDENYGSYQFTSIKDVINNFMISYVGLEKNISKVKELRLLFTLKEEYKNLVLIHCLL